MKQVWILTALAWSAMAQGGIRVSGTVITTATGKPVAGASVVLEGAEDSYVVESDGNGRFHADDVAPGKYEGRAEREGYTSPKGALRHVRFEVAAGEAARRIELRLTPLGSISGRVVDADGDPISKVVVEGQIYGYAGGRRELKSLRRAISDDRGEYRMTGVAAGSYYLRAEEQSSFGRSMTTSLRVSGTRPVYEFSATYFPSADDVESAVLVKLAPGGELRNQTITLRNAQTFTLRMTLTGSPGASARPTMGLMLPTGGGMMFDTQYGVQRQFPNMKPGTYVATGQDRATGMNARQAVKISNADVEVTLTPRPEETLRGSVRATGKAVKMSAVRIRLDASDTAELSEGPASSDGAFAISHLRAVPYRLSVTTPAGSYLQAVRLGEQMVTDPRMDIGQISGRLEIVLGTDGGTLEGVVVDADGAPVEGAVAVAAPLGAMREWSALVRSTAADAEGKFAMRDLAPGEYQVLAWMEAEEGAPLNAEFRRTFEGRAVVVRIGAGGRETVKVTGIE